MDHRKRLFKNLLLFITPLVVFIAILFVIPIDKDYAYHILKNECNEKAPWIYDRVFVNPHNIDVAFIGASRTKASFMDGALEDSFRKQGFNLNVVNLGYCRWGRNMDYAIIKDLFRHKKVKYLVIELHEEEERLGHIDFPYVADACDVLFPVMFFNQNFFSDLYHATQVRFDIFKQRLFYGPDHFALRSEDHGYLSSKQVANPADLAAAKDRNEHYPYTSTRLENEINKRFPTRYLQKIARLAGENGCKLFFVYLPGYGAKSHTSSYFDYCRPLGHVLLLPQSFLDDQANWKDDAHFNDVGSSKVSFWLAGQLRPYLANMR